MVAVNVMQIVNEAIETHGGMEYWNSLEALEAEISAGGFLFTAKQRPVLRPRAHAGKHARAEVHFL